jgi:tRNA A37 threonylcarbamoyladenosine synthetase subunit TsaC/SUA5/YrdC
VSYYQLTFQTAVDRQPKPVAIIRVSPEDPQAPRKAVDVLRAGGLIVFPTEEGYLVGCDALDPAAVQRLCDVTRAGSEHLIRFAATREQGARLTGLARPLAHPIPLELMRAADLPLAATAVPPGALAAPTAQHVIFVLGDAVDLALDAGRIRRQSVAGGE